MKNSAGNRTIGPAENPGIGWCTFRQGKGRIRPSRERWGQACSGHPHITRHNPCSSMDKTLQDFPAFMKSRKNRIGTGEQNTADIEGYFFEGADGSQMAFWTCHADRESRPHSHPFDEYMVCVAGQYTAILDGREQMLGPGDELFIPAGTKQGGRCSAGTRTIHAFGGKRIRRE